MTVSRVPEPVAGDSLIEEAAELMNLAGNSTRLKILFLLDNMEEVVVCDLAEMLGISVPAVVQHLAKLKAYGLVDSRRRDNGVFYRLSAHPFNAKLRGDLFRQLTEAELRSVVPIRPPSTVTLQQLHDPETGRLDARRMADYLKIPLKQLSEALGRNYSTVHKTPSAPTLQPALKSMKRTLEILEQVLVDRAAVLAWLKSPHADLGRRTPLEVILKGHAQAVEDMLEAALEGTPT
jgi:DNA-binding transcriptional ArsR family regulator